MGVVREINRCEELEKQSSCLGFKLRIGALRNIKNLMKRKHAKFEKNKETGPISVEASYWKPLRNKYENLDTLKL